MVVAEQTFALNILDNKARFSDPEAVGTWISNQSTSIDAFRAEVVVITQNSSGGNGTLTTKWKDGSEVKAQVSQVIPSSGGCSGPSDVIVIC